MAAFFLVFPLCAMVADCLSSLAWAEMYVALAYLFVGFDMQLFETGPREMRWKDHGVAHTVGQLKVLAKPRMLV